MSLLWSDYEVAFQELVDAAFQYERSSDPDYYNSLSPRVEHIIYRDTRYNLDFLHTAYLLQDDKVMADYARWLYKLLCAALKDRQTPAETAQYVEEHFDALRHVVEQQVPEERRPSLLALLECARQSVAAAAAEGSAAVEPHFAASRYEAQISQYMDALLHKNTRQALFLVQQFLADGIPLADVYVEILAESMRRVGELWHTARITVDTEHYCTSVTQMAMAQLYPALFESPRSSHRILCACPGTELHEMGARMVADLFESAGWDSVYLGAAVPVEFLLNSVEENQPDLVALSVTMPQHLLACREAVEAIKTRFPAVRVAVGGKAFESTHDIWTHWPVDYYTRDARELLSAANDLFS